MEFEFAICLTWVGKKLLDASKFIFEYDPQHLDAQHLDSDMDPNWNNIKCLENQLRS